ncbi:Rod shape-determining protein MreC [uncultured Rubrobacteraceae bacterium]|uniref:Cell shape-determining protein MreC n=1 Tax=uncultured Rubrobacteraceae bacterium TaxID=349277 RepID=A0A6J4QAH7_9ACTN|nr:Rod shape-determining protein MreC [uncultured Rubrobacteraceae bacterium]
MGRRKSSAASGLAALFILCVASLALFTVYVKEGDCVQRGGCGPLHTVQLGASEVLQPLRSVFATAFEPARQTGERVMGAFDDSEERRLREELQEAEALVADTSRLERENAELRELLEGQRAYYEYGPLAQVVAPVGDQFTQRIVINVGTEDGVEPNRPVVIGESTLIGRTTEVSNHTAQVMLVTDQMFHAGVRIIPPTRFDPASGEISPAVTADDVSYGQGLLETDLEGYFGVGLVSQSARAEEGDYVVTSGRAGDKELLFPPGLYVGKVESVSSQDYDQFKNIVVEPAMDPQDLQEVRVITDWAGRNG